MEKRVWHPGSIIPWKLEFRARNDISWELTTFNIHDLLHHQKRCLEWEFQVRESEDLRQPWVRNPIWLPPLLKLSENAALRHLLVVPTVCTQQCATSTSTHVVFVLSFACHHVVCCCRLTKLMTTTIDTIIWLRNGTFSTHVMSFQLMKVAAILDCRPLVVHVLWPEILTSGGVSGDAEGHELKNPRYEV